LSTYIWILIIIVTVMALYLLFYTYSVARAQKVKAGYDSTIDDPVKEHPYLKNPKEEKRVVIDCDMNFRFDKLTAGSPCVLRTE
jgi:hypothetical protein